MKKGTWSKQEEETLWNYIEQIENRELNIKDIARVMNRSYESVRYKYKAMGGNPLSEIELEYAMYKEDKLLAIGTASEIAKQLGIARDTVLWYVAPSVHGRSKRKVIKISS